MKITLLLVLILLSRACTPEPKSNPYIDPSPTPKAEATPWPKPDAEWQGPFAYINKEGQQFWLVCRNSGKIIVKVKRANVGASDVDPWEVYGGDGAGYGGYTTLLQAKAKAEEVVVDSNLHHVLLHCP